MKKIIGIALITFAIGLILFGGQKWLQTRDVNAVVNQYVTAMEQGNRASAQLLLAPTLRDIAEFQTQKKGPSEISFEVGVTHSIRQTTISGSSAVVNVLIKKNGFVLKPIIHLEKSLTNVWQITEINNLVEDPRWKDIQREQARQQDNQLANQLQQAFADRDGVDVKSRK